MPGSTISVFGDPDDYQAALREDGAVDLLVTGRGAFRARLTRLRLVRMHLLAGEESLARIAFIRSAPRLVRISLPLRNNTSMFLGEIPFGGGEIVTHGPGQHLHERTEGPRVWRTIWLPAEVLARYGKAMVGSTFDVPREACRWRPAPEALACLVRLHNDAIRVTRSEPGAPAGMEAARGLEQQVIEALVECLLMKTDDEGAAAKFRHADIMSRFEDILRTHPQRTPSLDEISATLGISGRTLRACCEANLGMGPHRYLHLRRMQVVRRALRDADGGGTSVSEVARRYGFGGLGRFAAAYREQFGELPSATLQHRAGG